jgi:hypothetical protein
MENTNMAATRRPYYAKAQLQDALEFLDTGRTADARYVIQNLLDCLDGKPRPIDGPDTEYRLRVAR